MRHALSNKGRSLALAGALILLAGLFGFVVLRSGPLAATPVELAKAQQKALSPGLFGIGTVEARATHKIGPTFAGRVRQVTVDVGEQVRAGQVLGEMDPIDLDDRIGAQDASLKRAEASVLAAEAQTQETVARRSFAESQFKRYERLVATGSLSQEGFEAKRQELQTATAAASAARANLEASRQELVRLRAERTAVGRQRVSLRLVSPVDGIVTRREADPGTTVVAGQAVLEIVERGALWISARFDQQRATGLRAGLPAQVLLRSQGNQPLQGTVLRVEPHADAVTEEILAKVEFRADAVPPIGELAEVTIALPALEAMPVVHNASIQRVDGRIGVWVVEDDQPRFVPVTLGAGSLDGEVQVLEGLRGGEQVVVYSRKALDAGSRIKVVDRVMARAS